MTDLNQKKRKVGFWIRIMAQNIDVLFSVFVFFILSILKLPDIWIVVTGSLLTLLYYSIFEASPLQATPGKMAMKIIVTNNEFKRITFIQSLLRSIAKVFSALFLFIGFSMIEYNDKKKGLHDYLAKTMVIFKEKV